MHPEVIELAESLGVTAEYLWAALLRQALISGIHGCCWVVLAVVWFWTSCRARVEWDSDGDPKTLRDLAVLISRVLSGIVFLALLLDSGSIIGALFNPEYWALMQVLEALG